MLKDSDAERLSEVNSDLANHSEIERLRLVLREVKKVSGLLSLTEVDSKSSLESERLTEVASKALKDSDSDRLRLALIDSESEADRLSATEVETNSLKRIEADSERLRDSDSTRLQ